MSMPLRLTLRVGLSVTGRATKTATTTRWSRMLDRTEAMKRAENEAREGRETIREWRTR
jgi:Tfp pilus assembly protein PilN